MKSDLTLNVLTSSLPTLVLVPKIKFTQNPLRHLPQYHVKDQKSCLISAGLPPKGTPMQVCYPASITDFKSRESPSWKQHSSNFTFFPLLQMSCVEEEIDRMNESFLDLSLQLQERAQMSTRLKERENSAGNHSVVISWVITYIVA